MNERIRELANQCRHEVEHFGVEDGFTYTEVFDEEKFAELIVRECLDIGANHKAYALMGEIMEHFGIEE